MNEHEKQQYGQEEIPLMQILPRHSSHSRPKAETTKATHHTRDVILGNAAIAGLSNELSMPSDLVIGDFFEH